MSAEPIAVDAPPEKPERPAVQKRRTLESTLIYEQLGEDFYAAMDAKPRASLVAQCDWALDNIGRLRALAARYKRGEETLPLIRELFLKAPGSKSINAMLEMLYDPKLGEKYRNIVSKADDDGGEESHRGRTSQKRFGVIEALKDVGRPLPPWLTPFGELLEETK